jgi:allantoin racemase
VYGMAEAACRFMIGRGRRYSIITGGAAWAPMLREFLRMMDIDRNLASIRTVSLTGAQIAADPERSAQMLANAAKVAMTNDGAESILLGGAGLIGQADKLAKLAVVDVVDSLEAALSWMVKDEIMRSQRVTGSSQV